MTKYVKLQIVQYQEMLINTNKRFWEDETPTIQFIAMLVVGDNYYTMTIDLTI